MYCTQGDSKTISRKHGELMWDNNKKQWKLIAFGKLCYVDKKLISKNEIIYLSNNTITSIKMGPVFFYFCPPKL